MRVVKSAQSALRDRKIYSMPASRSSRGESLITRGADQVWPSSWLRLRTVLPTGRDAYYANQNWRQVESHPRAVRPLASQSSRAFRGAGGRQRHAGPLTVSTLICLFRCLTIPGEVSIIGSKCNRVKSRYCCSIGCMNAGAGLSASRKLFDQSLC